MKKSHLIFSVLAIIIFLGLLILALQAKARTTTGDIAAEIKKQEEIILQAQKDYDAGAVTEQRALDIITTAQKTIEELQNKMTDQTSTTPGLSGYAWSSNIGWISFEGTAQDGSPYQVKLDADNYLSDYAWSPNVGWIKFDRDFIGPDGGNGAQYYKSTGQIKGWAQIPSLSDDTECDPPGTTCGADWADGWINFSGPTQDGGSYGVVFDTATGSISGDLNSLKNPNRWAWAGNAIGWIDFSGVTITTKVPPLGSVSLSTNPSSFILNNTNPHTTTLTCSGVDIDPNYPCQASGGAGGWDGITMSCNGDQFTTSAINTPGTYGFQIACTNTQGDPVYGSATLDVTQPVPAINLSSACTGNTGTITFVNSSNIAAGSPCISTPAGSLWSTLPSAGATKTNLANNTYSLYCTDPTNGPSNTTQVTINCLSGTSMKKIPGYKER